MVWEENWLSLSSNARNARQRTCHARAVTNLEPSTASLNPGRKPKLSPWSRKKAKRKPKPRRKSANADTEETLDASVQALKHREAEILFEQTFESNTPKAYRLGISSEASKSMALSLAEKVDATLKKIGASFNFSTEGKIREESHEKLFFEITF